MSTLFRLKYLLGLIPSAKKIDADWANLIQMRDKLHSLENSKEIIRYNELDKLINSFDFKLQKKEIQELEYSGSSEKQLMDELDKLEKSGSIRAYFKLLKSPGLERFQRIEAGSDLKRYGELKNKVESTEFQNRRKEIEGYEYKISPEYQVRKEYNSLSRNGELKSYFKTLTSTDYLFFKDFQPKAAALKEEPDIKDNTLKAQLKKYHKFKNSGKYANIQLIEKKGLAARLEQLKKEVNSTTFIEKETFLKDKNRYKSTKDYPVLKEYVQLSKDKNIVFYHKFRSSEKYKNFVRVKDSYELERLQELRKITNEPEFLKQVSYLKNKKRYESSELYKLEKEFHDLDKSKTLKNYRLLKKSPKLDFFNQWTVVFDENFDTNKLNKSHWQTENYWGYKMSGKSFSQAGEAQGFNGEKNILLNHKSLSIIAKKEKLKSQSWNVSAGLMPKEFDYSSGIINSAEGFKIREGVVEAKVKFKAEESITNAFSLTGSMPMPQIDVFRSGKKCVACGYTDMAKSGLIQKYKQIHGLDFNKYHVFRLEKFDHTLTWKINGVQVHSEYFSQAADEMFLNFVSSLHEPVNQNLIPHHFEIDWIRCYARNHNN